MAEAVRRRRDAIAGALLGAMVADALAMPTHWFYGGARQVLAEYGSAIKGYVQPNKRLAGSIMNKSSTGGGGRGDASGDVIGRVICHGKKPFWAPNESNHYHCTLKAGENTLEAQLCRLLARTITKDKGTFHASSFREAYANFMTTPGSHNDCYCSTCHRMFFANMKRGLPLEQCPDNDGHNVDTIDGLSLPTVVSLASARKSRTDSDHDVTECVRVTRNSPSLEAAAIAWNGAVRAVVNDNRSTKEAVREACDGSPEFRAIAAQVASGRYQPVVS